MNSREGSNYFIPDEPRDSRKWSEDFSWDHIQYLLADLHPVHHAARLAREQIRDDVGFLRDSYGLDIHMHGHNAQDVDPEVIVKEKLSLLEAQQAVSILRDEIGKYPVEYIQYCDVARLRLVKSVVEKKAATSLEEHRLGIAIQDFKMVYIAFDLRKSDDLRGTIHHELFHRGDQRMLEDAERAHASVRSDKRTQVVFFDRKWANINLRGESVYRDEKYRLKKGQTNEDMIKGFVSRYGTIDEMEDRATIAEVLMTNPAVLFRRCQEDKVLRKKTMRVIDLFQKRSNGMMDFSYFQNLQSISSGRASI